MTDNNKFAKKVIFNLEAVVAAAATMPTATGRNAGSKSELGNHILELLKATAKPMACKQIAETLKAGGDFWCNKNQLTIEGGSKYGWKDF